MKTNGEPKIEKGIPIPKTRGRSGGRAGLLRSLKAGESVVLPMTAPIASTAASYALGKGNYTVRTVEGGARVWRVK